MFVRINDEARFLGRAVDHEGEVLEILATQCRGRKAALGFLKRAIKRFDRPNTVVTDRLRSYRAATKTIGIAQRQERGHRLSNRAEYSRHRF